MGEAFSAKRYSEGHSLFGSSDSTLIKESEDLLSKFIGRSSQSPQAMEKEAKGPSGTPKAKIKIPRGNVQLRPESRSSSQGQPIKPRTASGPGLNQSVALPTVMSKSTRSSAWTRQELQPSPDSHIPKPAVARRSRRPRQEPSNYFKKTSISSSEGEKELPRAPRASARSNVLPRQTKVIPDSSLPVPTIRQQRYLGGSLRRRELGAFSTQSLCAEVSSDLKFSKSWKGASNDVVSLAWSPDGTKFAAGATAQCDEHMMAYNRKNNLLFGNLVTNELRELPDHWIKRPSGRSTADHILNDTRLFMSVTAVQWFGTTLYSASYDHTVKLWDTRDNEPSCQRTLRHDSKVVVMARSNFSHDLLATGADNLGYWCVDEGNFSTLEISRLRSRRDMELIPTSLAWGTSQATKDYLLAGMSEKEDSGVVARHGLLAAFRFGESSVVSESFQPRSQNVFDVTWHPSLPTFAAASTAGQQSSPGTRSVVNMFDPLRMKSRVMELECPALDINEVLFCPFQTDYVSASCTDGSTYVWDRRNHSEVLHVLKHGEALNQLDETLEKEQADTGVNLQLWGNNLDQFYTGGSDGMLKRWNILRAPEDLLVEDVASLNEGVMCGSFSPDKSNLLIGDVSGGIHLLSNSPFSPERSDFIIREAHYPLRVDDSASGSGIRAAQDLLSSGQIERHPIFGPGKGPEYKGPFAAWARPGGTPQECMPTTQLMEKYELRQLSGTAPQKRGHLTHAVRRELEGHITLASIRNQIHGRNKRRTPTIKQEMLDEVNVVDLCSDEEPHTGHRKSKTKPKVSRAYLNNTEVEIINLDSEDDSGEVRASPATQPSNNQQDDLVEDYWWPDSRLIDPNFTED
ncbi:WD40-repeat-containing domain protein [Aspergillus karnatakaensis]|uniref:WD repeat protein n=1 Tax=Aspergillus karnatakaensis TaxID=1810916 RepID=UPI003CCE298A